MIKIVVFGRAVFVGAVLLVIVIGYLLPKGHRASCSANFPHSPETLWQVVANRAASSWRSDVTQVELLSSPGTSGRRPMPAAMSLASASRSRTHPGAW